MIKSLIRSARRFAGAVADTVRETVAASEVEAGPVLAADPTDVYTDDEMPTEEEIEAAAVSYEKALDQARAGDRGKRAARKLLDRLPGGIYGRWVVSRVQSSRQVADLDAIRAIFKEHGLGPVPMKTPAPSLRVERMATIPEPVAGEQVLAAV
ncbi:hypothetical protein [Streptomyces griseoluteus]|uniref:hypothetical protein n=1 Tax=Streptomyces griseoluteus TaxID=29306 RepID=UPI0033223F2D